MVNLVKDVLVLEINLISAIMKVKINLKKNQRIEAESTWDIDLLINDLYINI